jgi:hypothetical protein
LKCALICRDESIKAYQFSPTVEQLQHVIFAQMMFYGLECNLEKFPGFPAGYQSVRGVLPETDLPAFVLKTLTRAPATVPGKLL